MRRLIRIVTLTLMVWGVSSILPARALPPGTGDYNVNKAPQEACSDSEQAKGHSLTYTGPAKLWPPNHKYYTDVFVVAKDSDSSHKADLTSTGTHNQYDGDTQDSEQNGTGHTADDIRLGDGEDAQIQSGTNDAKIVANESGNPADINWWVRSERSGHVSDAANMGREYTITAKAVFSGPGGAQDGSCEGSWKIIVPHDMRPTNR